MRRGVTLSFLILFFGCHMASAQFYTSGNDPAGVKYDQIKTEHFRIVYPRGLDTLASRYALDLERQRPRVGASIGFLPGEKFSQKWPVILRSYTSTFNGLVVDAPRRMELYTVMDAYAPDALNPIQSLTIHESRHVSQLQFGRKGIFGVGHILLGDIWESAAFAFYPNSDFAEGDAVVAETALTSSGRGRSSDFLEYVRVSLDEGAGRNYYQWRYGSLNRYTPDHYRAGYMMIAGARYVWNEPLFSKKYFDTIFRRPRGLMFPFGVRGRTFENVSGKNFRKSWPEIQSAFADVWEENLKERGPFIEADTLTASGRFYTSFEGSQWCDGRLISIRTGIARTPEIVSVGTDGSVQRLSAIPSSASTLRGSENGSRLFWSEYRPDVRWDLCSYSDIKSLDAESGEKITVMKGGKYYNPAPDADGGLLAVTEYPAMGGSKILVADSRTGEILEELCAPDSLQVVESAWIGERIITSAIGSEGFGLFDATDGFRPLLECSSAKIKELHSRGGSVYFTSDHNGVNELYRLEGKGAVRLTSLRSGASSFAFSPSGDSLYFSVPSKDAREICRTSSENLICESTDWSEFRSNAIADTLSAQENRTLAGVEPEEGHILSKGHYSKLGHSLRLHSWAPVYFDYDAVADASFEELYLSASVGATAFFQNDLSTLCGSVGYAWGKDTYDGSSYRSSGHLKLTYSGLFPVIEASLDYGDRPAGLYTYRHITTSSGEKSSVYLDKIDGSNSVAGKVKVYVPLNLSSGGWSRGLVASASWTATNDLYDRSIVNVMYVPSLTTGVMLNEFVSAEPDKKVIMQRLNASVRAYTMLPTAHSAIYPRLGIGAEVGYSCRPGLEKFYSPDIYEYVYGYVPGLFPRHGLKLTALLQQHVPTGFLFGDNYTSLAPRGLSSYASISTRIANYPCQARLTADYSFPFAGIDFSGLSPFVYIRNLEFTGHFDYTGLWGATNLNDGNLFSAGADLVFKLGNLLWLQYDTRIGVSWSYNGGSTFEEMTAQGYEPERHHFGLIFSMDF